VDFDAGRLEPSRVDLRRAVDGNDLVAAAGERQRRRLSRPREPENECVHVWKRSGLKPRRYW
jgi:hypothetical protein